MRADRDASVNGRTWHAADVQEDGTTRITAAGDERTRLEIGADEPEWIAHYLASLWLPFEVLEPQSVRDAVAALGARMVADHT